MYKSMNRILEDLEKNYLCVLVEKKRKKNAFQNVDVEEDLKWNMLVTNFYKLFHNIKV